MESAADCVVKETVENAIHEALCVKDCLFETLYGDFIPADGWGSGRRVR